MIPTALETVAAWCSATIRRPLAGTPPVGTIRALEIDSRKLAPGALFFALPGTKADGHAFLPQAVAAGAAAVVRADWPAEKLPPSATLLVHPDPAAALREIAAGYRRSRTGATIVAIAGSVGKTTTKELVADALCALGPTVRTRANLNNYLGMPLSVSTMDESTRYGVFEAGISHPDEMPMLADVLRPDAAVFTTIGPVHLEHFRSVKHIADEKGRLLDALRPGGIAVLDASSPYFPILRRHAEARDARIVTVAPAAAGVAADYLHAPAPGDPVLHAVVTEAASGESATFPLPPPGTYMAANLAPAVALARTLGAGWDALHAALEAPSVAPMRWDRSTLASGLDVVNDAYNANPITTRAAIDAFLALAPGKEGARRHIAVGPMLELGAIARDAHRELGRRLAAIPAGRLASVAVLDTCPGASGLARDIADAYAAARGAAPLLLATDYPPAAAFIRDRAAPGDLLLLKASHGLHLETLIPLL